MSCVACRAPFAGTRALVAIAALAVSLVQVRTTPIEIDTSKYGQTFDGIGGLSGGGATSRLLVDYPEPQRSDILDYMFKPNYGASLHILKVEIGGDSQSTDGCEPSHMHSADDLDYSRGYEWWLLSEAKKRNPGIKTVGLPWTFPAWVGGAEQSGDPFKHPELTTDYLLKWLEGARSEYGVNIDYVGIWNERQSDGTYAKTLRRTLDAAGFGNTTIIAKDGDAHICNEMAKDKDYADAVGVVGLHYPSDYTSLKACRDIGFGLNGQRGGKPIWSSEESSSYDDLNGAACWARVIASHWVLQGITSSIMWNLVGAYFHGTAWYASSMLTAVEPWSGNYHSMAPVWATAHVTQFTSIGWDIVENGHGSGQLPNGGFYVTYADPKTGDWTLTITKISEDHAPCTRPSLPHFQVRSENVTFTLKVGVKRSKLAVWYSNFEEYREDGTASTLFERLPDIDGTIGRFTLQVRVGSFFTVSTILKGPTKGKASTPIPTSQPQMPLPFADDFESTRESQEGKWWSDQIGIFEVHRSGDAKVMRQMVPAAPIAWTSSARGPVSVVGMLEWQDLNLTAEFRLPVTASDDKGACLGLRTDQLWSSGIVLCVFKGGFYWLASEGPHRGSVKPRGQLFTSGNTSALSVREFSTLSLVVVDDKASAALDGRSLFQEVAIRGTNTGFAAIGATDWVAIEYDSVHIDRAGPRWTPPSSPCVAPVAGAVVHARACATNGFAVDDQVFDLQASFALRHTPSGLCLLAVSAIEGSTLVLEKCDAREPRQRFKHDYTVIRNAVVPLTLQAGAGNLRLAGGLDGKVFLSASKGGGHNWSSWAYYPNTQQLRNHMGVDASLGYPMCLSTCELASGGGSTLGAPGNVVVV
mmetsp:Transcript_100821/g.291519  ORF Transcript_100821/g.291519 Transcript_100821/m.291519 type:complete len:867 (-) Transcript_100821:147-2747(-)